MIFLFFIKKIVLITLSYLITLMLLYLCDNFNFITIKWIDLITIITSNVYLNIFLNCLIYNIVFLFFSMLSLLIHNKKGLLIYILIISLTLTIGYLNLSSKEFLNAYNILSMTSIFIFDLYYIIYTIKYN